MPGVHLGPELPPLPAVASEYSLQVTLGLLDGPQGVEGRPVCEGLKEDGKGGGAGEKGAGGRRARWRKGWSETGLEPAVGAEVQCYLQGSGPSSL